MIEIVIPGENVAQGRPRATTVNGNVRMYDPAKSRNYKQYVGLIARQNAPASIFTGPLSVKIRIYRRTLKSFSKKNKALAESRILRPVTKPDLDNEAKSVLDACNGILYKDDSQIVDLSVSKFYSEEPRVEIRVEEIA